MFNVLAESVSELCVLAYFKGMLNSLLYCSMLYNDAQQIFAFLQFNSRSETGLGFSSSAFSTLAFTVLHFSVLHFPVPYFPLPHFLVLHFSILKIWSLIFQSVGRSSM